MSCCKECKYFMGYDGFDGRYIACKIHQFNVHQNYANEYKCGDYKLKYPTNSSIFLKELLDEKELETKPNL